MMVRVLDHDYRIFIALHIVNGLKKIKATPRARSLIEKFAIEITDVRVPIIHDIITDDDIEMGAELMLTQYTGMLIQDYETKYKNKNWFERLIMRKYFRDYKSCIEEFKAATEELCLSQIKIWQ